MTDKELLKDCYALLSDILESQNPDNSDEIQEMLNNIDSNCPWIQGKKKKKKKESLADLIIKSCQPIFDAYPNLKALPIYSWGRYYKYECAYNMDPKRLNEYNINDQEIKTLIRNIKIEEVVE